MTGSFLLIIIIGLLGMFVQSRLKNKFKKYSHLHLKNGLSGKEIAEKMLNDNGIYDVKVIGTEFNIKAYKGEKEVVTTLVKGSVIVPSTNSFKMERDKTLAP